MYDYNILKRVLTSACISDVLDELGIDSMLSSRFSPNFSTAKICGRAKTILVEKREPHEPLNGIYNGLNIFRTVSENDVIIVKNELGHLAYWGELNTMLALGVKASGTVVDGVTRDNAQTTALQYPVFSKGKYAKDIKNYGTVKSLNVMVEIDGVKIEPGDIIFGDIDGIAVIPKDREKEVIERAIQICFGEKEIIKDIIRGVDPSLLVEKHGYF